MKAIAQNIRAGSRGVFNHWIFDSNRPGAIAIRNHERASEDAIRQPVRSSA